MLRVAFFVEHPLVMVAWVVGVARNGGSSEGEHVAPHAPLRYGDSRAAAAAHNRFKARKCTIQHNGPQRSEREWLGISSRMEGGSSADALAVAAAAVLNRELIPKKVEAGVRKQKL